MLWNRPGCSLSRNHAKNSKVISMATLCRRLPPRTAPSQSPLPTLRPHPLLGKNLQTQGGRSRHHPRPETHRVRLRPDPVDTGRITTLVRMIDAFDTIRMMTDAGDATRASSRPGVACQEVLFSPWALRNVSLRSYSHSMVAGGLLVMSRTTRLTSEHSLVIRVEIFSSSSHGSFAQSAVMASSDVTGRSTMGCP